MTDRTFTLALQDGFDDDTVLISAAGKLHQTLDHVSTRTQIGLAREVQVTVPAGATALTIAVPDKGISGEIALGDGDALHFGASIDPSGGLTVKRSAEPFGYM